VCDASTKGIFTGYVRVEGAGPAPITDYWPTAVNNDWVYDCQGLSANTGEKRIVSSPTNGTYQFAPEDDGMVTGPVTKTLRKSAGDYFIKYADMSYAFGGFTFNMTGFEFLLLKDYETVGQTWSTTATSTLTSNNPLVPSTQVQTVVEGTMIEKGISVTVNGRTFTDVIHIQLNVTQTSNVLNNTYVDDYWFAKNIGPIKVASSGATSSYTKTLNNVFLYP
jgi:hypothetical protein